MSQDNPDTIIIEETARWESTQVEDVFLPSVRVQLAWADVEDAVASGAVVPAEAHSLWATWAMPGAPTRVANLARPSAFPGDLAPDGSAPATLARDREAGMAQREMPQPRRGGQAPRSGAVAGAIGLLAGLLLGCGLTYLALAA